MRTFYDIEIGWFQLVIGKYGKQLYIPSLVFTYLEPQKYSEKAPHPTITYTGSRHARSGGIKQSSRLCRLVGGTEHADKFCSRKHELSADAAMSMATVTITFSMNYAFLKFTIHISQDNASLFHVPAGKDNLCITFPNPWNKLYHETFHASV